MDIALTERAPEIIDPLFTPERLEWIRQYLAMRPILQQDGADHRIHIKDLVQRQEILLGACDPVLAPYTRDRPLTSLDAWWTLDGAAEGPWLASEGVRLGVYLVDIEARQGPREGQDGPIYGPAGTTWVEMTGEYRWNAVAEGVRGVLMFTYGGDPAALARCTFTQWPEMVPDTARNRALFAALVK